MDVAADDGQGDAAHLHYKHLQWTLAHYASGPEHVHIGTDDPQHSPYQVVCGCVGMR